MSMGMIIATDLAKVFGVYFSGVFVTFLCVRYAEIWYVRNKHGSGLLVIWAWPIAGPIALVVCAIIWLIDACGPLCSRVLSWIDFLVGSILKHKIHSDKYGTLYQMPSPLGPMRVVRVSDTTGGYWLRVPPDITKAKEAVAWTYDKNPDEFEPQRV